MSDEELPEWVRMLMDQAASKGYERGFENGQKQLWYQIRDRVEGARPYGA